MKILISLLFFYLTNFSQTLKATYDYTLIDQKDKFGSIEFQKLTLTANNRCSLLEKTPRDTIFKIMDDDTFSSGSYNNETYNIKEFKVLNPATYYFRGMNMNQKIVRDTSYNIKWTIQSKLKKILKYDCQLATADFRGRSYEVYFAPDIPFANGPFKFDGLPGLILEVKSTDGTVKITATSVTYIADIPIENPHGNVKTISWEAYLKMYKRNFDFYLNYKPDPNVSGNLPNRWLEYLIN